MTPSTAAGPNNPAQLDLSALKDQATGRLVVRRLRRRRHHAADRRRGAVRSARPPRRAEGARRRRRQRQCHARRGPPLVRGRPRPTMCRACSSAAAARRGRGSDGRVPGSRRRGAAVCRRDASTPSSRPSASCSRPTRTRRRPSSCGCASAAARSAWPTGRPTASSASCSRRWASTCRRRPA